MLVNRAREGKGLYDQLTLNLNGRDCSVYTIHSSFKIYPSRRSNNISCIYLIVIATMQRVGRPPRGPAVVPRFPRREVSDCALLLP